MKIKLFTKPLKANQGEKILMDLTCFDLETFIPLFNKNHEVGISYIQDFADNDRNLSLIGETLFEHKDKLDARQLGKCLTATANERLLQVFISSIEMRYVSFVDALKQVLTSFQFDGEAQIIEKITGLFAQKYYVDNCDRPGFGFRSSDACEILAFACVLLNTDLHTQHSNHKRMTKDQFINNLRGQNLLNNGENSDFERDVLLNIYKQIKEHEIKLSESTSSGMFAMPKVSLKKLKKMI